MIEFGVSLPTIGMDDPSAVRLVAEQAEASGLDSVWAADHIVLPTSHTSTYPYSADGEFLIAPGLPFLDQFTTLAYVAGFTSRVKLGTAVTLLPLRHPACRGQDDRDAGRALRRTQHPRRRGGLAARGVRRPRPRLRSPGCHARREPAPRTRGVDGAGDTFRGAVLRCERRPVLPPPGADAPSAHLGRRPHETGHAPRREVTATHGSRRCSPRRRRRSRRRIAP